MVDRPDRYSARSCRPRLRGGGSPPIPSDACAVREPGRDRGVEGRQPDRPLLDRDRELDLLDAALGDVLSGHAGVVAVAGPAGAGKSRLLSLLAGRASAARATVLRAAGEGLAAAHLPFEVARVLLAPPLLAATGPERAELLAGAARHAAAVLDDAGEAGAAAPGTTIHGIYWYVVALSDRAPLVLVIDDLQWADDASVQALLHLSHRIEDLPVLLAVGIRSGAEGDGVLAEVAGVPGCRVLEPAPLSPAAVARLAEERLGAPPEDALVAACLEVADGNPLLTTDLLDRLTTETVPGGPGSADALRASAVELFGDRVVRTLATQAESAVALARAVAVLGEDADEETCGLVAGLDRIERDRAAASLVAADVLDAVAWRCRHPLVRAAVVEGTGAAERARLHQRAARVLDSLARPLDRVATHLLAAGPPVDGAAVEVLAGAGARALARGATADAERFLRRALDGAVAPGVRVRLLTDLGVAERLRSPDAARAHLAEAMSLIASPRERAATVLNLVPLLTGQDGGGLVVLLSDVLDEFSAVADGPEDVELTRRLRALYLYCLSEQREHVDRFWTWFEATDPDALGSGVGESAQLGLHVYFAATGLRDSARTLADRARRAMRGEMAGQELFQPIYMGLLAVLAYTEDDADASAIRDGVLDLARRRHWPMVYAFVCGVRSATSFRNGRILAALADARTALELRRPSLNDEARLMLVSVAAAPLVELGELDQAAELLWGGFPATVAESWRWSWVLEGRSRVLAARGRPREALDALLECGEHLRRFGVTNPAAMPWQGAAALLHHELGERAAALALAEEHLRLARRWGTHGHVGAALRALGVVRGGHEGHALLDEALHELERSPKALETARAVLDLGASHRVHGRVGEARTVLRRSLDLAETCGSVLLAGRAREELVAAGGRPRRNRQSGPDALTPSESDVARFAARGLSNRDIAQALFVTQRTVELHLTNCYRKLRIGGRSQLAGSLGD